MIIMGVGEGQGVHQWIIGDQVGVGVEVEVYQEMTGGIRVIHHIGVMKRVGQNRMRHLGRILGADLRLSVVDVEIEVIEGSIGMKIESEKTAVKEVRMMKHWG
jgi:hypothetical protein